MTLALPPRRRHPLLILAVVTLFMSVGALIGAGLAALLLLIMGLL